MTRWFLTVAVVGNCLATGEGSAEQLRRTAPDRLQPADPSPGDADKVQSNGADSLLQVHDPEEEAMLSSAISRANAMLPPTVFTWAKVDELSGLVNNIGRAQPALHEAVATKMQNEVEPLLEEAQAAADSFEPTSEQITDASGNLQRTIAETKSYEGGVVSSFNRAEKKNEDLLKKVERADVTVVKQIDKYAASKLKTLDKAVKDGTKTMTKKGRGVLDKIGTTLQRMLDKIESSDDTEKMTEKAEQALVKVTAKHDANSKATEEHIRGIEELSDAAEESLEGSVEKLDELATTGEDTVTDATEHGEEKVGYLEEMTTDITKDLEEHMDKGVTDLGASMEKGVMDAEDWVTKTLNSNSDALRKVAKEAQDKQKQFETTTKASVQQIQNSLVDESNEVGSTLSSVNDVAQGMVAHKEETKSVIKEIRNAGVDAVEAEKIRGEHTLEQEGMLFGEADSAARRTTADALQRMVATYASQLKESFDKTSKQMETDTQHLGQESAEALDDVTRVKRITNRQSQRTTTKAQQLRTIGDYFVNQWSSVASDEKVKKKEFELLLQKMAKTQVENNAKVEEKVVEKIGKVDKQLETEVAGLKADVSKNDESAHQELESKIQGAIQAQQSVHLGSPDAVIARQEALGQVLDNFESSELPATKTKIAAMAQSAQEQIDRIEPAVEADLEKAHKESEVEFDGFQKALTSMQGELDVQLKPVLDKQAESLANQKARLLATADEAGKVTQASMDSAQAIADEEANEVRKGSQNLAVQKEQLNENLAMIGAEAEKKGTQVSAVLQKWLAEIKEGSSQFDETLTEAQQREHSKAMAMLEKMRSQAKEAEERVRSSFGENRHEAEKQLSATLEDINKKMGTLDPSVVQTALAMAKRSADQRTSDLEADIAVEKSAVAGLSTARVKASDEEEALMQRTFNGVDEHMQAVVSGAVKSEQKLIGAAGKEASDEAIDAAQQVRSVSAQFDETLDSTEATVGKRLKVEDQANADIQQQAYTSRIAARNLASGVAQAATGVKAVAAAEDAKFTGEMRNAGSELAVRDAAAKRKADGVIHDMHHVVTAEKRMVLNEERAQQSELHGLNEEAKQEAGETDALINKAGHEVQNYEHAIEEAETQAASLGSETRPLADKIADQLGKDDFSFHDALRNAAQHRIEQVHQTKVGLLEPIETVDDALEVLHEVQTQMTDRVRSHSQRVLTATDILDKRLHKLMELEKYQEEGAVNKVHGRLAGISSQVKKLRKWRDATDVNTRTWRTDVQNEFADMGHEIEIADLELHAREAQEQAMLDQTLETLQKELNFDLGSLDAQSAAQIQAIAAGAAKAIGALMMDSSLSDSDRTKQLAAIKLKMKEDTMKILNDVLGMSLGDKKTGRNLDAAMSDVETTVDRMALINSQMNKLPDTGRMLADLQKLIAEAEGKIAGPTQGSFEPASLIEGGDGGSHEGSQVRAFLAEASTADRAQAEREADAFLEREDVATSKRSQAEAVKWSGELSALSARHQLQIGTL